MDERGFISLIGLWLAAAATAIALTALCATRIQAARASDTVLYARALHAIVAVATLYYMEDFRSPAFEKKIEGCSVRAARKQEVDGPLVVTFDVEIGKFRRTVDVGWTRIGAEWQAAWWNER